ncbi:ADP-ribosylglycohydrolase [Larkinella arboricola]|uniref:ADP-ribosylglycohydrolase n=1 Tax=Larkinella arboricola TaxID=643671 RepID=A0A327WRS7_LARAB|nr:ADP-ribosylglycohydrolase family protein [Larkinella arboricola]RAJ95442.1 ADP-ribosylglycohydrolase [Larkinella arboricola]
MKKVFFLALSLTVLAAFQRPKPAVTPKAVTMSKAALQNKIKGGWAGQVIGCTFGGPTEFRYPGTMINDYQKIPWYDGYIKHTMINNPGLYDDLYMDLTFVDVFEKSGLDAPTDAHAKAYANAEYMLWHANQAGRYNILNGIKAPESGHWLNNPHADDIDFQIEADFSGLMAPGMPNTAAQLGDGIGHIMNYGDGWYGGVYVGAMYSLAFVSTDINYVVKEALKTIPAQSTFYQCIADVIKWHAKYPNDWKQTWFETQRKWSDEVGCPDGVHVPFNIDAKINAAYIVIGLLYGGGDFTKTMEISTRCGQDSDCNPSSAGGILGTMMGYDKIPAYWKMGLTEAEDIDFKYTTMSLNDVYHMGLKHALEVIRKNGGQVSGDNITIAVQTPKAVRLEQSFTGHFPIEKKNIHKELTDEYTVDFDGIGFVLMGHASAKSPAPGGPSNTSYVFNAELHVDGKLVETAKLPVSFIARRHELFWKYQLPKGKHTIRVKVLNPNPEYTIRMSHLLTYGDKPLKTEL